jgi:metal-dependent amidase/aminoacylase/carboxypeptidase family protein
MARPSTLVPDRMPAQTMQLGMRVYWLVVTALSLTLLGMAVHVATPRDAADIVEAATIASGD